jgi:hypothetical protein
MTDITSELNPEQLHEKLAQAFTLISELKTHNALLSEELRLLRIKNVWLKRGTLE